MDTGGLTARQKWILAAGIVLVVNLLFIPWYRAGGFVDIAMAQIDGWAAGFYAWGGSLCGIAAAAVLYLKAAGRGKAGAWQVKAEYVALGLAAAGFVLVLVRLITESSSVFIGTILALLVLAGMTWALVLEAGITLPQRAAAPEGELPPPPPPPPA
ncbi:MAG: hypothetical protein A2V75_05335 [Actinobacteria bacterium RBG_16_70_17]|nr:MAG: hypothetical protein A2V75_05335 [Actinobacteria bacterium RBG_16_70_17]